MRFDLSEVFLINRIGDIGSRKDGQVHIRNDAVERSCDASPDVGSQFSVHRQRSSLRQFGRRETIGFQGYINHHVIEIQTSCESNESAVCAIDGQSVEIDMVMLHDDRCLSEADTYPVRLVFGSHSQRFDLGGDVCLSRQSVHGGISDDGSLQRYLFRQLDETLHYIQRNLVQFDIRPQRMIVFQRRRKTYINRPVSQVHISESKAVRRESSFSVQFVSFADDVHLQDRIGTQSFHVHHAVRESCISIQREVGSSFGHVDLESCVGVDVERRRGVCLPQGSG